MSEMIAVFYDNFYTVCAVIMALLLLLVLVRAIIGPTIGDRLLAINMIGTLTIMTICILAMKMGETFLGDIPLVYALISFVAIVILAKIYIGVHKEDENRK